MGKHPGGVNISSCKARHERPGDPVPRVFSQLRNETGAPLARPFAFGARGA
jgi:hypothetical protein